MRISLSSFRLWVLTTLTFSFLQSPINANGDHYNSPHITKLTLNKWDEFTMKTEDAALIVFYSPTCPHCRSFDPIFRSLATDLRGQARFGAVDCASPGARELCQIHQIKGVPSIKLWHSLQSNPSKRSHTDFNYNWKDKKTLRNFVTGKMLNYATSLTENDVNWTLDGFTSVDKFLNENSHVPKVITIAKSRDLLGSIKALSHRYKDQIAFAQISCKRDPKLCDKLGLPDSHPSFPEIWLLEKGATNIDEKWVYDSEKKYAKVHQFLKDWSEGSIKGVVKEKVDTTKPIHATTPDIYHHYCHSTSKSCFLSLISPPDAPNHPSELQTVTKAHSATSWLEYPYVFISDPSYKQQVVKHYGLRDDGGAAAVLISPKSNEYTPYVGSWDSVEIQGFVEGVAGGKIKRLKTEKHVVLKEEPQAQNEKNKEGTEERVRDDL